MISIRNTAFLILLAVASNSALAEWAKVDESNSYTAYVDPTTTRNTGHFVEIWTLLDYRTLQIDPTLGAYRSARAQVEFDCKDERFRQLSLTWHSDKMAEGEVVFSDSAGGWSPVMHGTGDEVFFKFACKKR